MLTYSDACVGLTKFSEGFRPTAYRLKGDVWTIGYGHTRGVKAGDTCTLAQALAWLLDDLHTAWAAVEKHVKVELKQGQVDALTDFVFNFGETQFASSHLLTYTNSGDFEAAANEFQRWVKSNGRVQPGLVTRRKSEELMYRAA